MDKALQGSFACLHNELRIYLVHIYKSLHVPVVCLPLQTPNKQLISTCLMLRRPQENDTLWFAGGLQGVAFLLKMPGLRHIDEEHTKKTNVDILERRLVQVGHQICYICRIACNKLPGPEDTLYKDNREMTLLITILVGMPYLQNCL